MKKYGNAAFESKAISYAEDKANKLNRAESDAKDIIGMINNCSLYDFDKLEVLAIVYKHLDALKIDLENKVLCF